MNRIVTYVRTHSTFYIPGIGEVGPVLPMKNKSIADLKMVATENGITILGAGKEAFLPWPNVQVCTLEAVAIKAVKSDSAA
jgi:hypothetical protein